MQQPSIGNQNDQNESGNPIFRPAPARRGDKQRRLLGQGNPSFEKVATATVSPLEKAALWAGFALLALILCLPAWTLFELRIDSVLHHFMKGAPLYLMMFCMVATLIAYMIFVRMLFVLAPVSAQTLQTFMGLASVFLCAVGIIMLVTSMTLQTNADAAYLELWSNCGSGRLTSDLFHTYQQLYILRVQPGCADKSSVEDCSGFEASDSTAVLKDMEYHMACTGFCFQEIASAQAEGNNATAAASSFLQTSLQRVKATGKAHTQHHLRNLLRKVPSLSNLQLPATEDDGRPAASPEETEAELTNVAAEKTLPSRYSTVEHAVEAQASHVKHGSSLPSLLSMVESQQLLARVSNATDPSASPPYLFSLGTTVTSCESMAARKVRHAVGDPANAYFWLGVTVVCIWMCVTSLQFLGAFTAKDKREA